MNSASPEKQEMLPHTVALMVEMGESGHPGFVLLLWEIVMIFRKKCLAQIDLNSAQT